MMKRNYPQILEKLIVVETDKTKSAKALRLKKKVIYWEYKSGLGRA